MLWRWFQLLVVLGWVSSTVLLVRKSYYPDLGAFPRVEKAQVAEIYFEKRQTSDLLLVVEKKGARGRLTVTPRRDSVRLNEAGLESGAGEIFFTGRFDPAGMPGTGPVGEVIWNGSLFLSRDLEMEGLRLQVRLPAMNVSGQVSVEGEPRRVVYQVKQGGEVLADSRDQEASRVIWRQVALAARMGSVVIPGDEDGPDWPEILRSLAPEVSCRHGRFTILGRRYDGYVVSLQWNPEVQVKFFVTELGELLRVEGVPRVDILAESFVPEEMMEPEEGLEAP